jgi:hypothetical protein
LCQFSEATICIVAVAEAGTAPSGKKDCLTHELQRQCRYMQQSLEWGPAQAPPTCSAASLLMGAKREHLAGAASALALATRCMFVSAVAAAALAAC